MRKNNLLMVAVANFALGIFCLSGCGGNEINTINDQDFTIDGKLKKQDNLEYLESKQPTIVNFYIETSGGMKGYYPTGASTEFKTSLNAIMKEFNNVNVFAFGDNGKVNNTYSVSDFIDKMNNAKLNYTNNTKLVDMYKTILQADTIKDAVSVLVSDLRYSPEQGTSNNDALMQYKSNVKAAFKQINEGSAVSLVCATSEYKSPNPKWNSSEKSPYYFLIVGKPELVVSMRNTIIKELGKNFVEAVDFGMDYKNLNYELAADKNCFRLDEEPTFYGYNTEIAEQVSFKIKLSNFNVYVPMLMSEKVLKEYISLEMSYGSEVKIDKVKIDGSDVELTIVVSDMLATESDALTWGWNEKFTTDQSNFTTNMMKYSKTDSEYDFDKSFSINDFIEALNEILPNKFDENKYKVLISKKNNE